MTSEYLLILFAISQGALVLGLAIFIFWHYIPKNKSEINGAVKFHILLIALSYICLTAATIRTIIFSVYPLNDIWYFAVTVAYITGDISLLILLRHSLKNRL